MTDADRQAGESTTGVEAAEPFIVKRCNPWGDSNFFTSPSKYSSSDTAYFVIDWNNRGGDVFEYERLERPELDESTRAAEARAAEPVMYTLQQCVDVGHPCCLHALS